MAKRKLAKKRKSYKYTAPGGFGAFIKKLVTFGLGFSAGYGFTKQLGLLGFGGPNIPTPSNAGGPTLAPPQVTPGSTVPQQVPGGSIAANAATTPNIISTIAAAGAAKQPTLSTAGVPTQSATPVAKPNLSPTLIIPRRRF